MAGAAKVQAIDAVETLSVALRRFQEEAATALEELQMQVNRAVDWFEHDLKIYWKDAERRAWQDISAARAQLEQARTARRMAEYEPACREEKKVLERAQQRLRVAEAKLDKLRHWSYAVGRAVLEFRSGIHPLVLLLEADLPRGVAALRQMTVALESYVALHAPDTTELASPAAAAPADAKPAAMAQDVAKPAAEPAEETTAETSEESAAEATEQTTTQDHDQA